MIELTLLSWMAAALAGAVAHELAHWVVWRLAGRQPTLDIVELTVRPTTGPVHTTLADRAAAAAPYVLGGVVLGIGLRWQLWPAVFFGVFAIQIPSAADLAAMRGTAQWQFYDNGGPSHR